MITGYVLQRNEDHKFVTRPNSGVSSYSTSIRQARIFATREEAEGHRCGNETVCSLASFFQGQES